MGDSGLLKSALFFLCLILVVLLFMPKDCAKQVPAKIAAIRHTAPAPKGLRIETSTPPPAGSREVVYPEGIDAARLQYLIEVDPHFATPKTMVLQKQANGPLGNAQLAIALQSLRYIEPQPDGTYAFTRDGLLNVTATDQGTSWTIPVAKRQFVRVDAIDCAAADQCTVKFTWQWQPNDVGNAMQPAIEPHSGTARLLGGPGGRVVSEISDIDSTW
jgi:hypothetical protein